MKKVLILIVFVLIALLSNAQSNKGAIKIEEGKLYPLDSVWYVYQSSKSDTLIIHAPKIRYIKIDGEVYEIIRKTELKKAEPNLNSRGWMYYNGNNFTPTKVYVNDKWRDLK